MPEPTKGETQQAFVSRCVPVVLNDGTAESQDQAVAVCHGIYRKAQGLPEPVATAGREARSFSLVGAASGVLRTVTLHGDEHVVVEVVALVGNAVIKALGSKGYELVPAEVLEASVNDWNDAPVMADHPQVGGKLVSARTPEVLEQQAFGRAFNAQFRGGRLVVEAWLSRRRAREVGEDAVRVIERLEAGEPVEVSIGASVLAMPVDRNEDAAHTYDWVWLDIKRDHLAMLREGAIGACSLDMGCGAGRHARYMVGAEGMTPLDKEDNEMPEIPEKPTLLDRFAQFLGSLGAADGVVATPVPEPEARGACDCNNKGAESAPQEDTMAKSKAERVTALIDNPANIYGPEHRAWLEAAPEDVLAKLETAVPVEDKKDDKDEPVVAAPVPVATEPVETVSAAELSTLRGMASQWKAEQASKKAALVAELKGATAGTYTEAELAAMSVDQLERTAKLVNQVAGVDHSLRRAAAADPADVYRNPPDGWALALDKKSKSLVS